MQQKTEPTLQEWKDAVWDFMLEHSDITDGGSVFVKFHTDGRHNFENRLKGRAVHGYHRDDRRTGLTTEQKDKLHLQRRLSKIKRGKEKRAKWKADKAERQLIMSETKALNERRVLLKKYPKLMRPLINRVLNLYATARTKVVQYKR